MAHKSTFSGKLHHTFPTFSKIPSCVGRGLRKSWRYVLGFVVLLILFDIGLGIYATAQLNHQLALIRQKGEPLTLEELVPPRIPDDENAAVLYERAQKKIHFETRLEPAAPPYGVPDGSKMHYEERGYIPSYNYQKDFALYLSKNAAAIRLIRKASTMQKCRFDLSLNPYWGPNIKDVKIYNLLKLISLQANYEAHSGNTNAALQDVRCLFLMTKQFSTLPAIRISEISGMSVNLNRTLSKVLLYAKISPAQAETFESSLPGIDLKPLAYRDFLIDRIASMYQFNSSTWPYVIFKDNFPAETSLRTFRGILRLITSPLQKLDETYALKWWATTYKWSKSAPFPIPPDYRHQGVKLQDAIDQTPWYAIGTKFTIYVLPDSNSEWMEILRRERVIALALAAYRTRYHQYPSTLKTLEAFWGSALPKDLYGGKSFRYHSDGKTFKLYSVGIDRIDNGGSSYPYPDDIEWMNTSKAM